MSRRLSLKDFTEELYSEFFCEMDNTNHYNDNIATAPFNLFTVMAEVEEEFKGMTVEDHVSQIRQFVRDLFERKKQHCGVDQLLTLEANAEELNSKILQITPTDNEFPQTLSSTETHTNNRKEYLNIIGADVGQIEIPKRDFTIGQLGIFISLKTEQVYTINYLYYIFINSIRM